MGFSLFMPVVSFACDTFDGSGDESRAYQGTEICKIDGNGNRTITGVGQTLTILDKKDGRGNTALVNFGRITIGKKKDGDGSLTIERCASSAAAFSVPEINGNGHTYLRCEGPKTIGRKDGNGNIYFRGQEPVIREKNGSGQVIREGP
jgi:hypothetical protein